MGYTSSVRYWTPKVFDLQEMFKLVPTLLRELTEYQRYKQCAGLCSAGNVFKAGKTGLGQRSRLSPQRKLLKLLQNITLEITKRGATVSIDALAVSWLEIAPELEDRQRKFGSCDMCSGWMLLMATYYIKKFADWELRSESDITKDGASCTAVCGFKAWSTPKTSLQRNYAWAANEILVIIKWSLLILDNMQPAFFFTQVFLTGLNTWHGFICKSAGIQGSTEWMSLLH